MTGLGLWFSRRSRVEFEVLARYRPLLERAGVGDFQSLMHAPIGNLLKSGRRAELRRIELPSGGGGAPVIAYLKRTLHERPRKIFNLLMRGQRPHVDTYREMQLICALQSHGIAAMNVMAYGEERWRGLPLRGFVLVEHVEGRELDDLYTHGDAAARAMVMRSFGRLLGRLNALGFYQVVRLKDLICTTAPGGETAALDLTLIDRAATWASTKRFSRRRCLDCVKRSAERLADDGVMFRGDESASFAQGYVEGLNGRGEIAPQQVLAALRHLGKIT